MIVECMAPFPYRLKNSLRVCGSICKSLRIRSRCLVGLGLGRRQDNFLTDLKGTSRIRNLPRSSGTWRGEVAKRYRWLSRQLAQHSTVFPARSIPRYRQMCMSVWKKRTRVGWTRSRRSLKHHRLARVFKHPDSSVPRTRGHGRQNEPSPTAIFSLA